MLKHEALQKLGYEEQALVPIKQKGGSMRQLDTVSQRSNNMSALDSYGGRPKAIEYLNKGKEGKESVRDFINF